MKTHTSRNKRFVQRSSQAESSSYSKAMQESPPAYGLDFADQNTGAPYVLRPAGDKYEKQAGRLADRIMGEVQGKSTVKPVSEPILSLPAKVAQSAQASGPVASGVQSPKIAEDVERAKGKGRPLPQEIKAPAEKALGTNLGLVRLHTGAVAEKLNSQFHSNAFAINNNVFATRKAADHRTPTGKSILFHETVHTVQQASSTGLSGVGVNAIQRNGYKTLVHDPDSTEPMDAPEFFKDLKSKLSTWPAAGANLTLMQEINYNKTGDAYVFSNPNGPPVGVAISENDPRVTMNFWASAVHYLGGAGSLKARFLGLGDLKKK